MKQVLELEYLGGALAVQDIQLQAFSYSYSLFLQSHLNSGSCFFRCIVFLAQMTKPYMLKFVACVLGYGFGAVAIAQMAVGIPLPYSEDI